MGDRSIPDQKTGRRTRKREALFENLEDGATVHEFLEWFPGVRREQAVAVLEFAEQTLVTA